MNTARLKGWGFHEWCTMGIDDMWRWEGEYDWLLDVPCTRGVYIIRSHTPIKRARWSSDIFYIGRAIGEQGLRGRIRQHYRCEWAETIPEMRDRLFENAHDISWTMTTTSSLGMFDAVYKEYYVQMEFYFVRRYKREHGELPPWNQRMPSLCYDHNGHRRKAPEPYWDEIHEGASVLPASAPKPLTLAI